MITTDAWFMWKGVYSYEHNILAETLPPITVAQRRRTEIVVPGRNGTMIVDDGSYENTIKPVSCAFGYGAHPRMPAPNVDALVSWLDGSGELIFSNEPNRAYRATLTNVTDMVDAFKLGRRFSVEFDCEPLKYVPSHMREHGIVLAHSPSHVFGSGNHVAAPVITIYGSGNAVLDINGIVTEILDIDESITVNSQIQEVYKDMTNQNNKMRGNFPQLRCTENVISFSSNVTNIYIEPNWCWR